MAAKISRKHPLRAESLNLRHQLNNVRKGHQTEQTLPALLTSIETKHTSGHSRAVRWIACFTSVHFAMRCACARSASNFQCSSGSGSSSPVSHTRSDCTFEHLIHDYILWKPRVRINERCKTGQRQHVPLAPCKLHFGRKDW